ncbi:MAG: ABC transporter permease [Herbiconiux sp.]|uniref:ABC transporter permease n=1 Tax=Herbiconiux sp. TaxID=1871186 RepID=UPI0012099E8D|nr:ABC transporter permease [Herbiconiux sp.]TAJ48086.1 MAG: ABC transporter permease [Herbiconiux sp.]
MKNPLAGVIGGFRYPVVVLSVAIGLLLFVPFAVLVATSVTSGQLILFPPQGFSLKWYVSVLGDRAWTDPFWLSMGVSLAATAIAVLLGTSGALAVHRIVRPGVGRLVRTLFILPIALPPVAYAVGLHRINILFEGLNKSLVVLVLGEAIIAMPYVFVLVSSAMNRVDPALRLAASTMGASWPMILRRVELPIVLPTVITGAIFAFSVVFDEVVLSVFLTPPGTQTFPLAMLSAAREAFSPNLTAASTMVSLAALALLGIVTVVGNRRARGRRPVRKVSST